jgi:hypothetical protein
MCEVSGEEETYQQVLWTPVWTKCRNPCSSPNHFGLQVNLGKDGSLLLCHHSTGTPRAEESYRQWE